MTIKRVGILGSGIMGSGIAEVAAKSGHEVVLRSRKQASADAIANWLGDARGMPRPSGNHVVLLPSIATAGWP